MSTGCPGASCPGLCAEMAIYRHLTLDNLPATAVNGMFMVDGTVPKKFYIQTEPGYDYLIHRMMIFYNDVKGGGWSADEFASTPGAALANGLKLQVVEADLATVALDILDGHTIKKNSSWNAFCHDSAIVAYGAGLDALSARWTLTKDLGRPLRLLGKDDDVGRAFVMTVQDDLSAIAGAGGSGHILVRGYKVKRHHQIPSVAGS